MHCELLGGRLGSRRGRPPDSGFVQALPSLWHSVADCGGGRLAGGRRCAGNSPRNVGRSRPCHAPAHTAMSRHNIQISGGELKRADPPACRLPWRLCSNARPGHSVGRGGRDGGAALRGRVGRRRRGPRWGGGDTGAGAAGGGGVASAGGGRQPPRHLAGGVVAPPLPAGAEGSMMAPRAMTTRTSAASGAGGAGVT